MSEETEAGARRIRVQHFILDHRIGGPHVYVRAVVQMLASEVSSSVATTGQGDATDYALTNLRHRLRWLYPVEVIWNMVRVCWHFRSRSSRCRLVFDVHGAANIAPILAARLLGIPTVWHFHETVSSFDSLVALGKSVISGTVHKYVVVAARAIEVFGVPGAALIPGTVDTNFWSLAGDAGTREIPDGRLRLITVGNLNPLKGADILIDALSGLTMPWELTIVGAELETYSTYAAALHDKAQKVSSAHRTIEFVGWKSPEAVRGILADADVFVLPSRSEACPIALLEAMSMERACVASDVGDVREILSTPEVGRVFESRSPAQLAMAIGDVVAIGPSGRRDMGRAARQSVVSRFSPKEMAARHLEIYRELLKEAEAPN